MSWRRTAPPLSMVVVCNRERHRLRWEQGRVVTLDHPDLDAELALVAFGGEEPVCLALHRLWHDAVADGGFVAEWVEPSQLSPAWHSWLAMALERMRAEGFHEFLRHLPTSRAQRMGEFLHRFPRPWIDRAAAEVNEMATVDEVKAQELGAVLAQAAANRLRRAFVDAVGGRQLAVGGAALVPLTLRVDGFDVPGVSGAADDATPRIEGVLSGPGRRMSITIDASWLHRVWAAGAAVVDGHLVLAIDADPVETSAGQHTPGRPTPAQPVEAVIVTWHEGRPSLVTAAIDHTDGAWVLDRR